MSVDLEVIIGLEVHAQISTKTKMFCGCSTNFFSKPPNTTVCPICMGHPGTLPVPNGLAVKKALIASLALDCTVNPSSHFDRKHYFYPDLPAGFQISQYDFPLASKGVVTYTMDGGERSCRILRLHMENDAGKLVHRGKTTLCDYNRSGSPLMEIVTEPDLRSASEAVAFAEELRRILIAVSASEADMYKGMMRFDASISLRVKGSKELNPRSEIKNLNSFKALESALLYEEGRLRDLWESDGGPLKGNITVGWLDDEGKTRMLRDKENADDYRYFPEPDIPPLSFTKTDIEALKKELPALPGQKRKSYAKSGLSEAEILVLTGNPELAALFDAVQAATKNPKRAASIVLTQLLGFLKAEGKDIREGPNASNIIALLGSVDSGTISANAAKEVLEEMVKTGKDAEMIIAEQGLRQISDSSALDAIVGKAIAANPDAIASCKKGKTQALGALVGWVMKESKGQADPAKVSEMLKKKINES